MKKNDFIKELCDVLELDDSESITEDTLLPDLPQYDSMAGLALIAMADQHFGKSLSPQELRDITTVRSLMETIGEENFD